MQVHKKHLLNGKVKLRLKLESIYLKLYMIWLINMKLDHYPQYKQVLMKNINFQTVK